ncbi:MAG: hypothetical protein APF82_06015 [Sphingomonadales bacterium BRH_c42]|nr:MAG: hypothetical protein APF82_06015 [Sphingomonadales bacterium BRH_c42]
MIVTIFEADTLIGSAEIFALDPPMGVAMAKFRPAPAYDVERHANVVDGDYVADRGDILRIELPGGIRLRSQAISIQDWPALGEFELHILGILEPDFDELFKDHPDYRAYYDLDLSDEQRAEKQRVLTAHRRRRLLKEWSILGVLVASIAGSIILFA